ncbi:MAG: hypothetical protein VX725_03235, partial [Actinomycetota bacterium]|nr:hypothetical protein [Actinomycetota bacterium]
PKKGCMKIKRQRFMALKRVAGEEPGTSISENGTIKPLTNDGLKSKRKQLPLLHLIQLLSGRLASRTQK